MTTVVVDRPDDLGPALREVRTAEGVTQSGLADLAGVGRQWLNAFEMGEKGSAPLDMVMRIIAALDVSVTLTRPSPPPAVEEDELVDLDSLLRDDDG